MSEQTLGKLDEFMQDSDNVVAGTCANGVCTVHGPNGKAEYSEVFEQFVPAFFAGGQVLLERTRKILANKQKVVFMRTRIHKDTQSSY